VDAPGSTQRCEGALNEAQKIEASRDRSTGTATKTEGFSKVEERQAAP
jgi:hypothetical protein